LILQCVKSYYWERDSTSCRKHDCIPYVKKKVLKILSNNDDDNSKTAGLSKEIVIKIGAEMIIKRNMMLPWVLWTVQ